VTLRTPEAVAEVEEVAEAAAESSGGVLWETAAAEK
jgi:hypothetical protein